jgi:predicted DNA-binding transcriptional regulator AlpA
VLRDAKDAPLEGLGWIHGFIPSSPLLFKRTVHRPELRKIVPLANTTIYEMEQRGELPRRFFLTSGRVVWDLVEVEAWIEERRRASDAASIQRAPTPDVGKRKTRPIPSPVSGRPCPAKGLTEWYNSSEAYSEVLISMAGRRWNFCCTMEG